MRELDTVTVVELLFELDPNADIIDEAFDIPWLLFPPRNVYPSLRFLILRSPLLIV